MLMQRRLCVLGDEKCRPETFRQLLNCWIEHHPEYTARQIAEQCGIKYARLRKYVAESQTDQIPFLALVRIAAFLNAWELVDFVLHAHGRRTTTLDTVPPTKSALDEAIDVATEATGLLRDVRAAGEDGRFDSRERQRIGARVRNAHRELDEVATAVGVVKK